MDGRLTKALMGLGGTGAAAGGGLFLSNLLSGEGKIIDAAEEERAKILEGYAKEIINSEMTNYYVLRSHYSQEFWEAHWIVKVENNANPNYTYTFSYEKQEMENKEKEYWEEIMKGDKIKIDTSSLKKINGENINYWEKYKRACLEWNKTRTKEQFKDNYLCITSATVDQYLNRPEYKKYLEAKKENGNLSFREFYWTLWKKFSKTCDGTIKSGNFKTDQISDLYDKWKTDQNTCATK